MSLRRLLPLLVFGLAACSSDSHGSAATDSSAGESTTVASPTSERTTTAGQASPAATAAVAPLSLLFTFEGVDGLTPREAPQLSRSSDDEIISAWSSTSGITDTFMVLRDTPAPAASSPEGDVTAVSIDVPSGSAWLVTDNVVGDPVPTSATRVMWWRSDGRLWVVSNLGLTPQRLIDLTLAIQPGSGLPFVLPDPAMTFVGISTLKSYESTRQGWSLDGSNVELAVTNGGLARQLDVTAVSITDRTLSGAAGYEITMPNSQVNLIWPTDDPDRWGSVLIGPALTSRVDEIASAIVAL